MALLKITNSGYQKGCAKLQTAYLGQVRLLFIDAWNEWVEGYHLELDRKYGRAILEATVRANPENHG